MADRTRSLVGFSKTRNWILQEWDGRSTSRVAGQSEIVGSVEKILLKRSLHLGYELNERTKSDTICEIPNMSRTLPTLEYVPSTLRASDGAEDDLHDQVAPVEDLKGNNTRRKTYFVRFALHASRSRSDREKLLKSEN